MSYATEADIVDRYGLDALLLVADRDGDGVADADVVSRALADADAEIDAYLAAKYSLPLAEVPEVLRRLAVDITVYRLSSGADLLTDEKRQRYDDAIKLLKAIASGQASLGLKDPPTSAVGGVWHSSRPRRFKRS